MKMMVSTLMINLSNLIYRVGCFKGYHPWFLCYHWYLCL